jgi:YfiH family protein
MNLSFRVGDAEENVRQNREIFFGSLGILPTELALPGQVHGAIVHRIDSPGNFPDCDALLTNVPRVFLCITVADCVPILLFDPTAKAVGAVHAGWRGTASGILTKALERMSVELSVLPRRLRAYLGPAASTCCYVVGDDVASRFEPRFVSRTDAGLVVDLKGANVRELLDAGVPSDQIEISPSCTISESALFHSFRRDRDRSGRMMAVIGLKPQAAVR